VGNILGIRIENKVLLVNPCIPRQWPGFELTLTRRASTYIVAVQNPACVCTGTAFITLHGTRLAAGQPPVTVDDGAPHPVLVVLG